MVLMMMMRKKKRMTKMNKDSSFSVTHSPNNDCIFYKVLDKEMRKNNYTNKYLASKLNLSSTSIQKYRVGESNPKPENIVKLAKILDISIDYLLTGVKLVNKNKMRKFRGTIIFEEII